MRHYHSVDHSAFSLRPIVKRQGEEDFHKNRNFEAYFNFANGKGDWFPVNYFIVGFPSHGSGGVTIEGVGPFLAVS